MSRMELIHASLSGQLQQYDFDYDAAFARVLSDFTKPVEMTIPKGLKGELRPYQEVGLNSPGQGIAFSMPVDEVVGINNKKTEVAR